MMWIIDTTIEPIPLDPDVTNTQTEQDRVPTIEARSLETRHSATSSAIADQHPMPETRSSKEKRPVGTPRQSIDPKTPSMAPPTRTKTLDVASSYIPILSSRPADNSQRTTMILEDGPSSHQPITIEIDLQDSAEVWKHAMLLAGSGKSEEAAKFFKIHETLSLAKKSKESNAATTTNTIIAKFPSADHSSRENGDNIFSEGGISFIPGAVTSHMDIGFTPYFDKNLRELKGPIPLTIFNRQWQDLANSYHVEKRVKMENLTKDITTYTGYPYPHEMTQSYATWNTNYRNFVRTLRDVYHFKRFAVWAEIHQENVEFYHTRDNWMTAFRYDIKIRLNAFAFRVSHNGTNAPPDISQRREDIATICFAEARRLDEGSFEDNPYAKGGVRFGFDWTTGLPRSSNNQTNNNSHGSGSVHSTSVNDPGGSGSSYNGVNNNSKRSHRQSGGGGKQRGGYQGNNFDPNHAAKRQATSKNPPAPATT